MSKTAPGDGIFNLLTKIMAQADWSQISDQEFRQVDKLPPAELGRRFIIFLKAGAKLPLGGLKIACTTPLDLAKFIDLNWSFWRGPVDGDGLEGAEERDPVSMALTEVDLEKVDFLTCLGKGETSITGEEKLRHLRQMNRTLYGSNVFLALWQDYLQNKAGSILERLHQERGITYIDFFGDILRSPHGSRCVLFLYRSVDGSWDWHCYWLAFDWGARLFAAVSQQVS